LTTYIFYSFILFWTTLSAYLYERSEDYKKNVFYFMAFLIPLVLISFRYEMGTDYIAYVELFHQVKAGYYSTVEPMYMLLNLLIIELDLDVQWVFFIMGFLTILFSYKSFPKDGFALAVFLFIVIYYFQGGYNQIRQGLAVAIMSYAMIYIYEKNIIKYILFSLFAMSLHFPSGMILFSMYFFANMKINRFFLMAIVISSFFIVQQSLLSKAALAVIETIAPAYAYYLNGKFGTSVENIYGLFAPLVQAMIALIIFFFKEKIIKQYPRANIVINMYVFYVVFYFFRFEINIFSRLQYIFVYPFIFSLVYFIKTFHKKGRGFILFFLGLLYYLIFIRYIYNGHIDNLEGTHVRPYQTILFERD